MTKLSDKRQEWLDDNSTDSADLFCTAVEADKVRMYLIQKDAEHKSEIDELNSQIEFKIKECMELAQACSRYKQSLAQHDKQVSINAIESFRDYIDCNKPTREVTD